MADLFAGYGATLAPGRRAAAFDEMFSDGDGGETIARTPYRELHAALGRMTQAELRGRADALANSYLAQGVTFDFAGEERPFPLDAVPRVIPEAEWVDVEAGVAQLRGPVQSDEQRKAIRIAAEATPGIKQVEDKLYRMPVTGT